MAGCLDLPVETQGETLDELVARPEEALELHPETENLAAFDIAPHPSILANLEIDTPIHA